MKKIYIVIAACISLAWFSLAVSGNLNHKDQINIDASGKQSNTLAQILAKKESSAPAVTGKSANTKLKTAKNSPKKTGSSGISKTRKTVTGPSKKNYKKLSMPDYAPGQVLVKYKRNTALATKKRIGKIAGVEKPLKEFGSKGEINLHETEPEISVNDAIKKLESQKSVEFAEPNYIRKLSFIPNDPSYNLQWHLNNTGQAGGIADADINAQEAWDIEKGYSSPVKTAIIDTGIDQNHPDLSSKITPGYNFAGITQKYVNATWDVGASNTNEMAQSITGTGQPLTHIGLSLRKYGSPPGDILISVRETLDGPDLATTRIYASDVNNITQEVYKNLDTPLVLSSGTTYYIVFKATAADSNRYYGVARNYSGIRYAMLDAYKEGSVFEYNGSGWDNFPDDDFYFRTNPNSNPRDDNGHGTHTSGIAAASSDNNTGVSGLSFGSTIMPLKAAGSAGYFSSQDILDSLDFAVSNGAKVINMSFGGSSYSAIEQQAIDDAYNAGVVLVAAGGNGGNTTFKYPAAYNNVIGVGCTDMSDLTCSFSNYNSSIDVSAPGENIYSTMPTYPVQKNNYGYLNDYDTMSGTSMSAPLVSGLASLVLSADASLSPSQVETLIKDNAQDLGTPGRDNYFGYGRINAYDTLRSLNINLIQNPSFEIDDDANSIPDFWNPSGFVAGDGRSSDFAKEGNYSLKISGNPTTAKSASQIIAVGGTAGEQITVSGWNKTEGSTTAGRCVVALIYFNNTDGSRKYAGYLFFGRNTHDWLERSTTIIASKDYSSIDITNGYFYQTGATYFDDLRLIKQ